LISGFPGVLGIVAAQYLRWAAPQRGVHHRSRGEGVAKRQSAVGGALEWPCWGRLSEWFIWF